MALRLRPRRMPWGDYGNILWNGMGRHLPRIRGHMQLERTGPFMPPISEPGGFVVSAEGRRLWESVNLRGVDFRNVRKARIVRLDWHDWDLDAPEPREYPREGEPEGYILNRRHSWSVSRQLGPAWEIWSVDTTELSGGGDERMRAIRDHFAGNAELDVFRDGEWRATYCSDKAGEKLARVFGDLIRLEAV